MNDRVHSPSHYTVGGIETIDFIEAKQLGYNLGNVVKYVSRCGHKESADKSRQEKALEDLQKARWYLNREIENLLHSLSPEEDLQVPLFSIDNEQEALNIELVNALELLHGDVENFIDYGMPFENPEHGFHESVMAARAAIAKATGK